MLHFSEISTTAPTDERIPLEKKVYAVLDKLKIPYERVDHEAAATMEECVEIDKYLGVEIRKNIFLCNRKKTSFFLLIMPANKPFVTKDLSDKLGCSRLSFAPEEYLEEYLGVKSGSATVMGVLNDEDDYVQVLIDKEVADGEWYGCNPGINTSHIKIKTKQLLDVFLPYARHRAKIVEL